jgi:hypothetical protein
MAAQEFLPMGGLTRRPGSSLPAPPTQQDIEALQQGKRKFDFDEYVGDYAYWFASDSKTRHRDRFLGLGGLTSLYIKDVASSTIPTFKLPAMAQNSPLMQPLLQQFDIEGIFNNSSIFFHPFFERSKQVFGRGLEQHPQYKGFLFIVPLLESRDFFTQARESVEEWFQVFDVYVNESPRDGGVLLATRLQLEDTLSDIIEGMRAEDKEFPVRVGEHR